MYGIIYKATNLANGKIYIGQTTQKLKARKQAHAYRTKKGDRRSAFQIALLEHGFDSFQWEQIDTADTAEELNQIEKYWIAHYKADDPAHGYNLQSGGFGAKHTAETKQKLRELQTGKKYNPMSEKGKRNISEARKGKSSGMKGKHHSAETREKIRENMKGKNTWQKGKKHSEETLRKMRESQKRRWEQTYGKQTKRD